MVGIYKTHDVTKTLTINPSQIMEQVELRRKAQMAQQPTNPEAAAPEKEDDRENANMNVSWN